MGFVQTGSCPSCGAPIYAESPFWSIYPPPPSYTCACRYATGFRPPVPMPFPPQYQQPNGTVMPWPCLPRIENTCSTTGV